MVDISSLYINIFLIVTHSEHPCMRNCSHKLTCAFRGIGFYAELSSLILTDYPMKQADIRPERLPSISQSSY